MSADSYAQVQRDRRIPSTSHFLLGSFLVVVVSWLIVGNDAAPAVYGEAALAQAHSPTPTPLFARGGWSIDNDVLVPAVQTPMAVLVNGTSVGTMYGVKFGHVISPTNASAPEAAVITN